MSAHRPSPTGSIDEARFAAATDWLQRLDQAESGGEEVQQWLEWFGSSDLNRQAFEEARLLRQRLRQLPAAYRRELQQRVPLAPGRGRRRVLRWCKAMAVAASLFLVALMPGPRRAPADAAGETVYVSPAHAFRTVTLEDGSSLVLGADAAVAVAFDGQRRTMDIRRGGAYFEVRRDERRPFVVHAAGVKVTAIGTAFKVARFPDRVVVTVTEGVVEVEQAPRGGGAEQPALDTEPGPVRLEVGQRKELALAMPLHPRVDGRASPMPAWRDGRVEFVNAPLGEVVSLVNRHAPVRIAIEDPRVEGLTYSGTVERRHIDEWIASLPHVYAIRVVKLDDGTVALVSHRGATLR